MIIALQNYGWPRSRRPDRVFPSSRGVRASTATGKCPYEGLTEAITGSPGRPEKLVDCLLGLDLARIQSGSPAAPLATVTAKETVEMVLRRRAPILFRDLIVLTLAGHHALSLALAPAL